jgi:hypothetical protein
MNPLSVSHGAESNIGEFKKMYSYMQKLLLAVVFLVCSNFYLLYSASHLIQKMEEDNMYVVPDSTLRITEPHSEVVYDSMPDLSTSQSKHVVNLAEYTDMDSDFKDNVFNNLDSIIVQDGDLGTTRHQITKVNWLFDEADTMLLYTALGEVFALAANGTISMYDTINGARRLLQSQAGWLEGKISDVIHHGSSYKEMRERGKAYMRTREIKKREDRVLREMNQLNKDLEKAELRGEDVTHHREEIESLQDQQEIIQNEKSHLPLVEQKPLEEKNVDSFLKEQVISRIEKEFQQEKLQEITEFRNEKQAEIQIIKLEKDEVIHRLAEQKNETVARLKEEKNTIVESYSHALNATRISKEEELQSIRYDLDLTKVEIELAKESMLQIINRETNRTVKEQMVGITQALSDTSGKLAFTQLIIKEGTVAEHDRRPKEDRHRYDKDIISMHAVNDIEDRYQEIHNRRKPTVEYEYEMNRDYDRVDEEWTEEMEENIAKHCSTTDDRVMCVCTDTLTRDVFRC